MKTDLSFHGITRRMVHAHEIVRVGIPAERLPEKESALSLVLALLKKITVPIRPLFS
jgi:hypothetical protein